MSGGCDACGIPFDLHDEVEFHNCRADLRREERRDAWEAEEREEEE